MTPCRWPGALLLVLLASPVAAVSEGRLRNRFEPCRKACLGCYQCSDNCVIRCMPCRFCLKRVPEEKKATAEFCLTSSLAKATVHMARCNSTNPGQKWKFNPESQQLSCGERCLTSTPQAASALQPCAEAASTGPQWTFNKTSGLLKSMWQPDACLSSSPDACVGAVANATSSAPTICLGDCDATKFSQQWLLEPSQSMGLSEAGAHLNDKEWSTDMRAYSAPVVNGDAAVLDPDGDGFINRTAAQIIYEKDGGSVGGHQCTPMELLPTDEIYAQQRENLTLKPAPMYAKPGKLTKIYYINLDWDYKRRNFMEAQLKKIGVPYERFPAITADAVKNGTYDAQLKKRGVAPWMEGKWGSIACTLSHHTVYEKILKEDPDGNGLYFVLEDDAKFVDDWEDRLQIALDNAPPDWTVLLGGWWNSARCTDVVNEHIALALHPQLVKIRGQYQFFYAGADVVVLSPKRLPSLLQMMEESNIDQADINLLSNGSSRCYAPLQTLAQPAGEASLPSDRERVDAKVSTSTAPATTSIVASPTTGSPRDISEDDAGGASTQSAGDSRIKILAGLGVLVVAALGAFLLRKRCSSGGSSRQYEEAPQTLLADS